MHFLPAVQRQNDVLHLRVEKFDRVVVEEQSVGGRRKEEALAALCRLFLGVCNSRLDDVQIHERLAAEEVNLEHLSCAAVPDEEVDRLFGGLRAHHLARGVIGALVRKAVLAAKIAVVADMQAERLDLVRFDGRGGDLLLVEKSRVL